MVVAVDRKIEVLMNDLKEAREDARSARALRDAGGGGTSDGMGPWEASVDRQLGQLHTDVRDLLRYSLGAFVLVFGAIITVFIMLSSKIDASTERLATKIDGVSAQVSQSSEKIARLEGASEAKPKTITAPDH